MDLEKIKGIGSATAERMISVGIDSVEKVAQIKLEELLMVKGIGESTALRYIEEAKKLMNAEESSEKIETIIEESSEKIETIIEEKEDIIEEPSVAKEDYSKTKVVSKKKEISTKKFKEILTKQAECNIGLVGHVDHGMIYLIK